MWLFMRRLFVVCVKLLINFVFFACVTLFGLGGLAFVGFVDY